MYLDFHKLAFYLDLNKLKYVEISHHAAHYFLDQARFLNSKLLVQKCFHPHFNFPILMHLSGRILLPLASSGSTFATTPNKFVTFSSGTLVFLFVG